MKDPNINYGEALLDEEIVKVIKCAFKYTQDKMRDWYE